MDYDVAIIGSGVSGASTAWQLSHYGIKCILFERNAEICSGVSKANSGIVHAGFHHAPDTLKARLELRGNLLFDTLSQELSFTYHRCGILVAAFTEAELETVKKLYDRGIANGVRGLELCSAKRLLELEPKLKTPVSGGMFAPFGGTVEPYQYVFALMENAIANGVVLRCNCRITGGIHDGQSWILHSANGDDIRARYVINAAGLYADDISRSFGGEEFRIRPRKGEEYLLDRLSPAYPSRVIFPVPGPHSKGMLVIPTAGGTTMIGPTADWADSKEDVSTSAANRQRILESASKMVNGISQRDIITAFSGLRPVLDSEDFYIGISSKIPHFIQVAGIQSPGLTASPAIGEYVRDLLQKDGLALPPKETPYRSLPPRPAIRHSAPEEIEKLHAASSAWTNIVCRCESISEAEIIEAVRRGHTTVDGVKFYTRAGMGRCQGGFCSTRIMKIISRESGIAMDKLTKHGGDSRITAGHLGDLEVTE